MRFFFSVLCLVLLASSVLAANSCNVGGLAGTCVSTKSCVASGGTSTAGLCPNDPKNVRCCTYGTCKTKSGVSGKCVSTKSCAGSSGTSVAGLCPGPKNIQCCVSGKPKPKPPTGGFNAKAVIAAARRRLGVPYVWGGGHKSKPGPSLGTCVGYTGSIKPCPAEKTVGLDCSGLVRDAIYHGIGLDLANGGNTNGQIKDRHTHLIDYKDRHTHLIDYKDRQPGDIEFFGTLDNTYHVILYIGKNSKGQDMMIEAQKTGTDVHEVPLRTGGIWARVRK